MSRPDFTSLSETLLRGGIAARHVQRYVRELGDHFDDVAREAMAGGKSAADAEHAAAARIGSVDQLAQTMLAREDLKAWGARYPWAVYGLGPLGSMIGCMALFILTIFLFKSLGTRILEPAAEQMVFNLITSMFTYVLPPLLALAFVLNGVREGRDLHWVLTGALVLCVLGAGFDTSVVIHPEPVAGMRGQLNFGMAWVSPYAGFPTALVKLIANVAIVALVLALVKRNVRVSHG